MLKAAEGNGSSFRLGITNNDISINDYEDVLFPCQAEFVQPDLEKPMSREDRPVDMRVPLTASNAVAFTNLS